MKKAFKFVESLKPSFFDVMGYPTIEVHSDYVSVCFSCSSIIKGLEILELHGYDEMKFFADCDDIKFVYTFYIDED